MILYFATKVLPLYNMRNSEFSWGKRQQKAFENIKINYVLTHLYNLIFYKMKQQLLQSPLKKPSAWFFSQEGHPVIYVSRKLTPVDQNDPNHQSLHEHHQEIEINPTHLVNLYPQTCLKRREDVMISKNHQEIWQFTLLKFQWTKEEITWRTLLLCR